MAHIANSHKLAVCIQTGACVWLGSGTFPLDNLPDITLPHGGGFFPGGLMSPTGDWSKVEAGEPVPWRVCAAARERKLVVRCRGCSDRCKCSRVARSTQTHDPFFSSDPRSTDTYIERDRRTPTYRQTDTHTHTYWQWYGDTDGQANSWPRFFIWSSIFAGTRIQKNVSHRPGTPAPKWPILCRVGR